MARRQGSGTSRDHESRIVRPFPSRHCLRRVVSGLRRRHGSALARALGGGLSFACGVLCSSPACWPRRRTFVPWSLRRPASPCRWRSCSTPSSGPSPLTFVMVVVVWSRPDGDGTAEHRIGPCRRHRSGRRRAPVVDLRTGRSRDATRRRLGLAGVGARRSSARRRGSSARAPERRASTCSGRQCFSRRARPARWAWPSASRAPRSSTFVAS